jgi:hypothetical protein
MKFYRDIIESSETVIEEADCGKLFNRIPEARMELEYTHSWKLEGILKVNIDRQDRRLKTGDSSLLIIQNLEG